VKRIQNLNENSAQRYELTSRTGKSVNINLSIKCKTVQCFDSKIIKKLRALLYKSASTGSVKHAKSSSNRPLKNVDTVRHC
jgi:hypothetical protein